MKKWVKRFVPIDIVIAVIASFAFAGIASPAEQAEQENKNAKGKLSLVVNLVKELAIIKNISDEAIDLTDYSLLSVVGDQEFVFPEIILKPGETVTVTSGKNARDDPPRYLLWTKKSIWNDKGDPAELYDADGELVATCP